ncbi:MAG: YbaB/EbfC family nucleoid-associated protein [Candidatus Gracilibacteria bacterium]|nr:YbaB/EbfC family nucleoid-associated protein [Candidatus Gracilibacteria bacterium]
MFDQAKELYELQKQAKKIKDELGNIHIESTEGGVKVTINGEQVAISCEIDFAYYEGKQEQIGKDIVIAMNKAVKKSQGIAAEKMKDIMGGMGLGGPATPPGPNAPQA